MATVKQNTLVRQPDTGEVVVLNAGEDVPEWAASQVGSHLTGSNAGPKPKAADKEADAKSDDPESEAEKPKPATRRGRR